MKEITLREFQTNASKYSKHKVLTLTKYGKPLYRLERTSQHIEDKEEERHNIPLKDNNVSQHVSQHSTKPKQTSQHITGKCQSPYCSNTGKLSEGKRSVNSPFGSVETVKCFMCDECISKGV